MRKRIHRHPEKTKKNDKKRPAKGATLEGTIKISPSGFGTIRHELYPEGVVIAPEDTNTALSGDSVVFSIIGLWRKKEGVPQGKVTKVLYRANAGFAGVVISDNGVSYIEPRNPHMLYRIKIEGKATIGSYVFVTIDGWKNNTTPYGHVTEVLGEKPDHEAMMQGIALEKGFASEFSALVLSEANKAAKKPIIDTNEKRRDFRNENVFTIDPVKAKDFDDAVSIKKVGSDYEVGIHIADVSHYVVPGTALDTEALQRATSVYLVDRTIPMLPQILSDDICSLVEGKDRATMSVVCTISIDGIVKNTWIGPSIINSKKRFTYEEADKALENPRALFHEELVLLQKISQKLRKERERNGSIIIDDHEAEFVLDEAGKPIAITLHERGPSSFLIEEWMLLANTSVATFLSENPYTKDTTVYRVHDKPNITRIQDLRAFLKLIGIQGDNYLRSVSPKSIAGLLKHIEGHSLEDTIRSVVIRSMAKAIYTSKNIGHFGLAFETYTHFTSPIRRYPDTMIHRLIRYALSKTKPPKKFGETLDEVLMLCSLREKNAEEAERTSKKWKHAEYFASHIGLEINGVITGITDRGIFIEDINTKGEGMAPVNLMRETTKYDKVHHRMTVGKESFRLGEMVKAKVHSVDIDRMLITYENVIKA